jgi:hypothetical protein
MNLSDLLAEKGIKLNEPNQVLVMRHTPTEEKLRKVLPWLAAEHPEMFNAYQQTQKPTQEKSLSRANYLASFIGHEPREALFIGLYEVRGSHTISCKKYWQIKAIQHLRKYGVGGLSEGNACLWFDLNLTKILEEWRGKLIVNWPPLDRNWCRWAHANEFRVKAIVEESLLSRVLPEPDELVLSWAELKILPKPWRAALAQWRGIYLIFDVSDCMGYVGAAYGKDNLYGRWLNYSKKGHGDNTRLRKRSPENFRFSILQLVSPSIEPEDVIRLESTWKERLHTREFGLNGN